MSTNPAEHPIGDPAELASLYAVGALPAAEQAAFEAHLATRCPACVAEVRSLDRVIGYLAEVCGPENVTPSAAGRERLLRELVDAAPPNAKKSEPAEAREKIQVWRNWGAEEQAGISVLHNPAGSGWEPTEIDGIEVRKLAVDRERDQVTCLIRMAPGTAYPRHRHSGREECYVLEGSLHSGRDVLYRGDYKKCDAGSIDESESTQDGCLLLIISSMHDEFV